MRFQRENTAAIIVDYQERIVPAMEESETLLAQAEKLIKGLQILEVPMIVTQQYTKGLGMTIPQMMELFGEDFHYTDKVSFSVYENEEARKELEESGRKQIIVCGIEAHVCVLMTCLDLKAAGYDVIVAVDSIRSRKKEDYAYALERMKQEGIFLTTTEAILFELTSSAKSPYFKEISKLVK